MMPAEKPRRVSSNLGEAFLRKKMGSAPKPVERPAPRLPRNPYVMRFRLVVESMASLVI